MKRRKHSKPETALEFVGQGLFSGPTIWYTSTSGSKLNDVRDTLNCPSLVHCLYLFQWSVHREAGTTKTTTTTTTTTDALVMAMRAGILIKGSWDKWQVYLLYYTLGLPSAFSQLSICIKDTLIYPKPAIKQTTNCLSSPPIQECFQTWCKE